MVEKLQHISLDTGVAAGTVDSENAPGMVDGWDYVNPRAPYDEYMYSPYQVRGRGRGRGRGRVNLG